MRSVRPVSGRSKLSQARPTRRSRAIRALPIALVVLWATIQLFMFPAEIALDWMGWRQADTQTIAENFLHGDSRILYPAVNWGGDGPGYVEAEFQLYTYVIFLLMKVFGVSAAIGQSISLLSVSAAILVLFYFVQSRLGLLPAFAALGSLLAARPLVFVSTTVQPDAFSFLFYVVAFVTFAQYLDRRDRRMLAAAGLSMAISVLTKPTMLHLGIFQFLVVSMVRPRLLKRPELWSMWGFVLGVLAVYYWHGAELYAQYGNTFGVGLAGDSKFPTIAALLRPDHYVDLVRNSLRWGIGPLGAVALLALVVLRKLDAMSVALGIANFALLLVAFRYTTNESLGPHYHLPTVVLGAWLFARFVQWANARSGWWPRAGVIACFVVLPLLWFVAVDMRYGYRPSYPDQFRAHAAGEKLGEMTSPGDLICVLSGSGATAGMSGSVNNYEDPIVFHVAKRKGWVLPRDVRSAEEIERAFDSGARYYVETKDRVAPSEFDDWVQENMELVVEREGVYRIYARSR